MHFKGGEESVADGFTLGADSVGRPDSAWPCGAAWGAANFVTFDARRNAVPPGFAGHRKRPSPEEAKLRSRFRSA